MSQSVNIANQVTKYIVLAYGVGAVATLMRGHYLDGVNAAEKPEKGETKPERVWKGIAEGVVDRYVEAIFWPLTVSAKLTWSLSHVYICQSTENGDQMIRNSTP
jgi:hypothetical protein